MAKIISTETAARSFPYDKIKLYPLNCVVFCCGNWKILSNGFTADVSRCLAYFLNFRRCGGGGPFQNATRLRPFHVEDVNPRTAYDYHF